MKAGDRVRSRNGWLGTVRDPRSLVGPRHYRRDCREDGTDLAVEWDADYLVNSRERVVVYPGSVIDKLERIDDSPRSQACPPDGRRVPSPKP